MVTPLWAETLLGSCPPELRAAGLGRKYDLTLLCDADVSWVADPVRYLPGCGEPFFARCEQALRDAGRPSVVLRGGWGRARIGGCGDGRAACPTEGGRRGEM
jgi:HTH-type transcriptional repressor of NAD biosynthesis genes